MAAATALPAQASLQPPGANRLSLGRAALLALLAHGALIVALTLNLDWRWRTPQVLASAELWAAVPQAAAPALVQPAAPVALPPAPPTPPPPAPAVAPVRKPVPTAEPPRVDAQIAIEKARKAKLAQAQEAEAQRLLKAQEAQKAKDSKKAEQQRQELAAEREAKAAEERLAKQREANLERMRSLAGATSATGTPSATGTAARDAAPSASYGGRIKARIKPNIVLTTDVSGNPITEVEVRCAPDGSIIGRRISKSSGNSTWDETVLRAIDRTEVLPRDVDGRVPALLMLVFPRRE